MRKPKQVPQVEEEPPISETPRVGIFIVEPVAVVRVGLSLLVSTQADMEVLDEAAKADECLSQLGTARRSNIVVLTGLGLRGKHDAMWLIRSIRECYPTIAVVAHGIDVEASVISRALFVGADGFIDLDLEPVRFLDSVRLAAQGEMVLETSPGIDAGMLADGIEEAERAEVLDLTDREREILLVAAEGLSAREIGDRLSIRERTVTTHLGHIYGKLGVGSRLAAVRMATESGLFPTSSSR